MKLTANNWLVTMLLAGLLCSASLQAKQPYVPVDDSVVLERLPKKLFGSSSEIKELRARAKSDPEAAAELAGKFIGLSRDSGEPRYMGYAQSAIDRWWDTPEAPISIRKVRAKLLEQNHQYDAAAADLIQVVETDPKQVQSWIELANIYRVQGKYDLAERACDDMQSHSGTLSATIARAPLMAVTGQAQQATDALAAIPETLRERSPATYLWLLAMRAELARIQGDRETAERLLKTELAHRPDNRYAIRAYADLLLDANRYGRAIRLTENHLQDNGVLLRAAIASKESGDVEVAAVLADKLSKRFTEIRLRGDEPHGRFEARFALQVQNDPEKALRIALANWEKQKESRDARNVLEAALALRNPDAAKPVVDFLAKHKSEDTDLQRLIGQLSEIPTK